MAYLDENNNLKIQEQKPINEQFTDIVSVITEQDLTSSYVDFGSEIDMENHNILGIFIQTDVNDSENVDLNIVGLMTSGGDEYEISATTIWTTGAVDFKEYYPINVGSMPIVKIQAKAGTVGATAGDLTIKINKKYN